MPSDDVEVAEQVRSGTTTQPAILYKYMNAETAWNILSTGKLRAQSPLRYNDPFDSQWNPLWSVQTPAARALACTVLEQAIRDPQSWPAHTSEQARQVLSDQRARIAAIPPDRRDEEITQLVKGFSQRRRVPEWVAKAMLDQQRRMRIVCFSRTELSILMWSHYADSHRGVVLGFDAEILRNAPGWSGEDVQYTQGPPELFDPEEWARKAIYGLPRTPLPELRRFALTKHSGWEYEREWRRVETAPPGALGDQEDVEFPRKSLVELITGIRTDQSRAMELRALTSAYSSDVAYFQLSKHLSQFELIKTRAEGSITAADGPS